MTGKQQRTVRRQLFPEKLWDLVNKPLSGIQWSSDGKRIEVDRSLLEKCLETKFRLHKFDSFIRQLHLYGFKKCGNSYHHDKFQRGKPEALLTMKRKYSNSSSSTTTTTNTNSICKESTIVTNPIPTHPISNNSSNLVPTHLCNNFYQLDRVIYEDYAIDYSLKSRLIMRCISVKNNSAAIHNRKDPMAAAANDQEK